MKNLAWILAGAAAAAAITGFLGVRFLASTPGPAAASSPALPTADWKAYGYQDLGRVPGRQFNVRFKLTFKTSPASVRLLLHQQNEENYDFVEIASGTAWIGRVEDGLEREIGLRSPPRDPRSPCSEVLVKRRPPEILVYLDGSLAASAWDDAAIGGSLFLGFLGRQPAVNSLRVQPVEEIYFADDFMKASARESDWEIVSGRWEIKSLQNPSLSSNAFFFAGTGSSPTEPAIAVAGHEFWDNFSFRVACRPDAGQWVGIGVHYRSPDEGFFLRWGNPPGTDRAAVRQLVKRAHGLESILEEESGGYVPGQWYELQVTVLGGEISASVDGHVLFRRADPSLSGGRVALYTVGPGWTEFDDARVWSERGYTDRFGAPSLGPWQEMGGCWKTETGRPGAPGAVAGSSSAGPSSGFTGLLRARVEGSGKCVFGSSRWTDYRFQAVLSSAQAARVGLCAAYGDESNFTAFRAAPSSGLVELIEVLNGQESVLEQKELPQPLPMPSTLALDLSGGLARGILNGRTMVQAPLNPSLDSGLAGLVVERGEAAFADASVSFHRPPEPVLTVNEVFAGENSMAEWANSERDWTPQTEPFGDAQAWTVYWHRADFPGDSEIEVRSPATLGLKESASARAALTLCATGESTRTGYRLEVSGGAAPALALYRRDDRIAEAALPSEAASSLKLQRKGPFVLALADGRRMLSFRDPDPLPDCRVAFSTTLGRLDTSDLSVASPNVCTYNFQTAPDEWRAAGGRWEVTSRWQCDPRWSFFCGRSKQVAAIWNKRELDGDVTLDFCAAIQMDSSRGGMYEYASDINATLAGDGRDLSSGYSFCFGGRRNRGSQILRGRTAVAESDLQIPRQIHHRWFYIKIRKRGQRFSYWVDGRLVAEYADPDPLQGNRVALWTYHNGLMLSRVRISSESGKNKEMPGDSWPAAARCCYED
ncbi:MAG: hypothetical protein HYU36_18175 [Planctomycetes bacterium]|nr:hypothetical protein [Planctomycetota bacterium]